jgi:methyl-accepting chemotaxis protein
LADTITTVHTSAQQIKASTDHVLESMEKLSETATRLALSFREEHMEN